MKHVAPRGRKEAAAMAAQGHGAVVARRARRNLRDGAALAAPSTSSPSVAAGAAWFERGAGASRWRSAARGKTRWRGTSPP